MASPFSGWGNWTLKEDTCLKHVLQLTFKAAVLTGICVLCLLFWFVQKLFMEGENTSGIIDRSPYPAL